jgi:glycosyltransferase involved in cell wall biosynthesis
MDRAESPAISVIIPTYNRAQLVGRAIQSVLDQTHDHFEVIVVDDGSADNTWEVIQGFDDGRICYIRHPDNRGGSAARNTGIGAARGQYVAFLDSDDEWLADNLIRKHKALDSAPAGAGAVYSKAIRELGDCRYTVPQRGIDNRHESTVAYFCEHGQLVPPGTLLVARSLVRDVLFDESLERHQDGDFLIRLGEVTDYLFIDEPLVIWHDEAGREASRISALPNPKASRQFIEKHREAFLAEERAFAGLNYRLGVSCLRALNMEDGRQFLRASIAAQPFRIKPPVLYLASMLGRGFVQLGFKMLRLKVKLYSGLRDPGP